MSDVSHFLLVEKYRPKTINDCILPAATKKTFTDMVAAGDFQHLLLTGKAGCGKTTVARALCNELDIDYLFINASEDSGIDVLRTKIRNFASTMSLTGGKKAVILDEADNMNAQSTQPALRGFIEEFSKSCRFIFTCNFKNKILDPIQSRCSVIDFRIPPEEEKMLMALTLKRVNEILKNENIQFEPKVVALLVKKWFPDMRRILNEIQRYSVAGVIDAGILSGLGDVPVKQLVDYMKAKNFAEVRKWIAENNHEPAAIFRAMYDSLKEVVQPASVPQAVVIIAEYLHRSVNCVDQEINLAAAMVELMMQVDFK